MIVEAKDKLLDIIGQDTQLRGGPREYAGPCPKCGGRDRFHVNPSKGWFCRQCTGEPGGSDAYSHWNDLIDYYIWRDGVSFGEAAQRVWNGHRMTPEEREKLVRERHERERQQKIAEYKTRQEKRKILAASGIAETCYQNLERYNARMLWHDAGLTDEWIDYFRVGFHPNFRYGNTSGATLTIPFWQPRLLQDGGLDWQIISMVHRILVPRNGDKYLPHMSGLGKNLFKADLFSEGLYGDVLLVEGEKKAMVTWSHLQSGNGIVSNSGLGNIQVVGTSGKGFDPSLAYEFDDATHIYIALDPDAIKSSYAIAEILGPKRCSVLSLPDKIDDMLIAGSLEVDDFPGLFRQARRTA